MVKRRILRLIGPSTGRACRGQQVVNGTRPQSSQHGRHERGHKVAGSAYGVWRIAAERSREKMYSQGGIFSITSRILVVDLLSSKDVIFKLMVSTGSQSRVVES